MPPVDPAAFIRAHLPLCAVPGVAGVRLHRAVPTSGLSRLLDAADASPPYWAHHWGGGLALAAYLRQHPRAVAGRRVLDLGTGSGLVAIAAALAGATAVEACDVDPLAIVAARLNAQANGVAISAEVRDGTVGAPPPVDCVLVGDLFYEAALAERVLAFLDRCMALELTVLIGDPRRASLPLPRLRLLAEVPVTETGTAQRLAGVYALR